MEPKFSPHTGQISSPGIKSDKQKTQFIPGTANMEILEGPTNNVGHTYTFDARFSSFFFTWLTPTNNTHRGKGKGS